ncbi:MAG: cupin domain-containing protein [Chitinivibrionia bacterium]|nr:cupin domain-containing protein [Chitinivibrionia bacterium]
MEIKVKKAGDAEIAEMKSQPTWGCDVSEFSWHYDSEERALILDGEVSVDYNGKSVSFGAGDYVIFPAGLSCVWKVIKPVKKHYLFR